jgi:hypothetical protein
MGTLTISEVTDFWYRIGTVRFSGFTDCVVLDRAVKVSEFIGCVI